MTGTRLKAVFDTLQKRGLISTKKEFCDLLGIDYGSLGKYLSGKVKLVINETNINRYKQAGISVDWLLTGEGEMFRDADEAMQLPAVPGGDRVPLLRQRVSCGPGQDWTEDDSVEAWIDPVSLLPSMQHRRLGAFAARGLSMTGAGLRDGDIVLFDRDTDAPGDDIYVFALDGDVYCKLLKYDGISGRLRIYSMHTAEPEKAELLREINLHEEQGSGGFYLFGRVLGWLHENTVVRRG